MKIDMLWAPWRLEYIKDEKRTDECPFCRIGKEEPSKTNLVLASTKDLFVVLNKFPYNPGHLMVLPKAHVAEVDELEGQTWQRLARGAQVTVAILRETMRPQGFNMGLNLGAAAGAGIPKHLHWHVLPRWNGDTNFMPLIAETKAVPTHMETIWTTLAPAFGTFSERLESGA